MDKVVDYNVRIVDHGDGKFSIGFIHRLKKGKTVHEWVDGNRKKLVKLLTEGELK